MEDAPFDTFSYFIRHGLLQLSPGLARVVLGTLFWNMLLPLWRHGAPGAHVSVTLLG